MNINKTKTLWAVFGIMLVSLVVETFIIALGINIPAWFQIIKYFIPALLLVLHASWALSYRRAAFFVLLAMVVGFMFEYFGVHYGVVFGGSYEYQGSGLGFEMLSIPILVPILWAVLIYTAYTISNSFLSWLDRPKPALGKKTLRALPWLILLDGLLVVAIDVLVDPLYVHDGYWVWLGGGAYFGIPLGNFVGWFLVAAIASGIYRIFEFFFPYKSSLGSSSVMLIPVLGYVMTNLFFSAYALTVGRPELVLIGLVAMLPIVLINFVLYSMRYKHKIRSWLGNLFSR